MGQNHEFAFGYLLEDVVGDVCSGDRGFFQQPQAMYDEMTVMCAKMRAKAQKGHA
ncbi:hypothetical protein ALP64_203767 [Pseudomonas syringae pv. actinidiae]|nr:hypothetical protein ALP64_203767 [Pseudomonas syringae pv. actinidiae]